jgi:hypothetical protein
MSGSRWHERELLHSVRISVDHGADDEFASFDSKEEMVVAAMDQLARKTQETHHAVPHEAQQQREAADVLCGLACEQRYLDTKGLSADNERPACLGAGSGRSSTGKSASRKRSCNESQGGAATKPRQKAADKTVAVAQAEDALALPRPKSCPAYYGVRASKKRRAAYIYYCGKVHYVGTFDTKQEFALAYDR